MTSPARIKQDDLTRIFRAAKAADYPVSVTLRPTGEIIITPVNGESRLEENPWD